MDREIHPSLEHLPRWFIEHLESIEGRRPRVVIDHILKHGSITTEELATQYGYTHPPRAARDVRERGIPLRTSRVTASDGRRIASYTFGEPESYLSGRRRGRGAWPVGLRNELMESYGPRCAICWGSFEPQHLQIDHRIPFEIGGDTQEIGDLQLLCAPCNRTKSWSCEHCPNFVGDGAAEVCGSCYWANPEMFGHVATQEIRRLDITWSSNEVERYDSIAEIARRERTRFAEFVKKRLEELLD